MRDVAQAVTRKWMRHAPHLWWGDRLDGRFLLVPAIRVIHGVRILDIGCNAGVLLSEVPDDNDRIGVDRSPDALRLAVSLNPTARFALADMRELPFVDASIDVALFCGMVEVLPRIQQPRAIREVVRVLRPGGRLYLTTLNRSYRRYRHQASMLTYEELEALLRPQFEPVIRGFNPIPPFPYGLPNRVLARVPGIWGALTVLMERGVARRRSCTFLVEAVKRGTRS